MKRLRQKKYWPPILLLFLSLSLYSLDFSNKEAPPVSPEPTTKTNTIQAKPEKTLPMAATIPSTLDGTPSPFATLPTSVPTGASVPLLPTTPPAMPSIPSIPNFSPPLPSVPGQPAGTQVPTVRTLTLAGILYRPGNGNLAIITDGQQEVMVEENTTSPWGYVSKITPESIRLNGETMWLDRDSERNTRRSL